MADTPGAGRGLDVLEALRRYRAADAALTRRRRPATGMGETDILAMLYLVRAGRDGNPVNARDLAAHLSISAASTTQLIDRLEAAGHVRREPHPTDRRGVLVIAERTSDAEIRSLLADAHPTVLELANRLTGREVDSLTGFLDDVVDLIDSERAEPERLEDRRRSG